MYSHIVENKIDIATIKTDVCWLKKFQWVIITAVVGTLAITAAKVLLGV